MHSKHSKIYDFVNFFLYCGQADRLHRHLWLEILNIV